MKLNKSSKVWNSANSFSKWHFGFRCHHISQNKPYCVMWQPSVFHYLYTAVKIWLLLKTMWTNLRSSLLGFSSVGRVMNKHSKEFTGSVTSARRLEKVSKHRGGLGRACLGRSSSKAGIQFCRWRKYKRYVGKKFNLWWKSFENEVIKMWTNTVETNYFKK